MKKIIILIAAITLSACAMPDHYHRNAGDRLYKEKNYQEAFNHWVKCAKNGDIGCMNNLGILLYQSGHQELGVKWLQKAASHGNLKSAETLQALNKPVPPVNRVAATQESESANLLGLANAILEGYNRSGRDRIHCDSIMIGEGMIDTECR